MERVERRRALVTDAARKTREVRAGIGTMRAAVHHEYGEPVEVTAVEDVRVPAIADDEVLVRVRAAGVNWADRSMTIGEPYVMRLGYGLTRPRRGIRGMDVAGVVAEVGASVTDLAPGHAVFGWCTGAFAEYVAVSPAQLMSKPDSLSFSEAAGLPLAGCVALQAVRDIAAVEDGDEVLVVGASGGIGSCTVQIAKAYGAHVTGVCSTPNLDFVRSLGAERVIDYTTTDFTLGDARYDMILDMADRHSLSDRRRVMTDHGTLIPNAGTGGRWVGSLPRIVKARLASPFVSQRLRPFLSMHSREDLEELIELVAAGSLRPVVGGAYPLDQTGKAIAEAGGGHARGKVVVVVSNDDLKA
jgi:NADPH:quinone reductase-like Zn-dependent oxidoreductase